MRDLGTANGAPPLVSYFRENLNDLYVLKLPKGRELGSKEAQTLSTLSSLTCLILLHSPGTTKHSTLRIPFPSWDVFT